MARKKPPHRPTARSSTLVENMIAAGLKPTVIAGVLDITTEVLQKEYGAELEFGRARVTSKLIDNLINIGTSNSRQAVAAIALWMKNCAGWSDRSTHELTGPDGRPIEHATVSLDEKAVEAIRRRYITNGD